MCSIDYVHHDDYLSYVYVGSMPNSRMSNEDHLGLLLSINDLPESLCLDLVALFLLLMYVVIGCSSSSRVCCWRSCFFFLALLALYL